MKKLFKCFIMLALSLNFLILQVEAKELKFFGDIDSDSSFITVINKLGNLADSSVEIKLNSNANGLYNSLNLLNNVDKEALIKIFNKLFVSNYAVAKSYKRGYSKMQSGNEKFLMGQFNVIIRNIYINKIPFVATLTFDFEESMYYTHPEDCIKLSDGTIMAYYLSAMSLKPEDRYNEIYDFDEVVNMYRNKYQEDDCEYYMDGSDSFLCMGETIQLDINHSSTYTQEIMYSQRSSTNYYPRRAKGLEYDIESYQNYLKRETNQKYEFKRDSSNMI